jgi:hypothetical protein
MDFFGPTCKNARAKLRVDKVNSFGWNQLRLKRWNGDVFSVDFPLNTILVVKETPWLM